MAKTPITIKQLVDASEDATSLEEFVYKPANYLVKRRLAPDTYSLQHYIDNFEKIALEQIEVKEQTVRDVEKFILNSGFITVDSFENGATITQRNQALRHAADGKIYRWAGNLPKVVPASSTPANSGGIAANAWLEVNDVTLRQDLANPDTGAMMVARAVVYADSVKDLLSLSYHALKSGQQVSVSSWREAIYAFADPYFGGGTYVWFEDFDRTKHNGGTVIAPDIPWVTEQPGDTEREKWEAYLNAKGNGLGCFVRLPDGSQGLRPEWFGAHGDAVINGRTFMSGTDDYPAFRRIVDIIEESQGSTAKGPGISCMQLSERGYLIGDTIHCVGNMRILGSHNPKMLGRGPTSYLTGLPHMTEGIFNLRGLQLSRPPSQPGSQYGFEIDHVGLRGYRTAGSPLPCAIKSSAIAAPARPFIVSAVHAEGFYDVFLSQTSGAEIPANTGIYNFSITNSVFASNQYTLRGLGKLAVGGLIFKGNVSEQGGRLFFEDGALFGTAEISNNLLEGQSDSIRIGAGAVMLRIGPNYWEGNTGVDIHLASVAAPSVSSVVIEDQFTSSSPLKIAVNGNWRLNMNWISRADFELYTSGTAAAQLSGTMGFRFAGLVLKQESEGNVRNYMLHGGVEKMFHESSMEADAIYSYTPGGGVSVRDPNGRMLAARAYTTTTYIASIPGPIPSGRVAIISLRVYRKSPGSTSVSVIVSRDGRTIKNTTVGLNQGWNYVLMMLDIPQGEGLTQVGVTGVSADEREAGLYIAESSVALVPYLKSDGSENRATWIETVDPVLIETE